MVSPMVWRTRGTPEDADGPLEAPARKRRALVSDCFVGIRSLRCTEKNQLQKGHRGTIETPANMVDAVVEHELDPSIRENAKQGREVTLEEAADTARSVNVLN